LEFALWGAMWDAKCLPALWIRCDALKYMLEMVLMAV